MDDLVSDRKANEIGQRTKFQFAHHSSAVRFDSLDAQVKKLGNPLVAVSFGEKLDDFALSRCQSLYRRWSGLRTPGFQKAIENYLRNASAEERLVPRQTFHGWNELIGRI